jgi:hypothetical protein
MVCDGRVDGKRFMDNAVNDEFYYSYMTTGFDKDRGMFESVAIAAYRLAKPVLHPTSPNIQEQLFVILPMMLL